ncbi:hypothetical protein cypCar_00033703 [Cyprinus carpio]|nr:hypothetical protein cypCar_00033703 [Cyprinus carpio]
MSSMLEKPEDFCHIDGIETDVLFDRMGTVKGEKDKLLSSHTPYLRAKRKWYALGATLWKKMLSGVNPSVVNFLTNVALVCIRNKNIKNNDPKLVNATHPVTWQPSKDGDRLIGRILLNKRMKDGSVPRDSGALLGLKVVGGKMTESRRLCAFITKVRKGSLADTVGHLRPGDQVLEWNGRKLQGATFKEVYNIILESKPEPQVELVVSRPIGDIPRIPESTHAQLESSSSSFESQKMERPSISVTSPMSPGVLRDAPQYLSGQLTVKLWYDKVGHQLIVTILGAKDLPSREDGRPRNPYVKIYFLPDRR